MKKIFTLIILALSLQFLFASFTILEKNEKTTPKELYKKLLTHFPKKKLPYQTRGHEYLNKKNATILATQPLDYQFFGLISEIDEELEIYKVYPQALLHQSAQFDAILYSKVLRVPITEDNTSYYLRLYILATFDKEGNLIDKKQWGPKEPDLHEIMAKKARVVVDERGENALLSLKKAGNYKIAISMNEKLEIQLQESFFLESNLYKVGNVSYHQYKSEEILKFNSNGKIKTIAQKGYWEELPLSDVLKWGS